jgi:two-component system cell cycle response regulator
MNGLSHELLTHIVQLSPDGMVVCERGTDGWPVIFANEAFERLTGYSAQELRGRDLRLLQGEDRDQENRQRIRAALAGDKTCRVLMRNYRKDGTQFWNEMLLAPIKDASGHITYFVGYHRDAGERLRFEPKPGSSRETFTASGTYPSLLSVLRDDRLTGLNNRGYFDEMMRRDWVIAQRDGRRLALLLFDIDCLHAYNETFGRTAGDSCIKRVARAIAGCLRRGSDLTARLDGGTIVALIQGMATDQVGAYTDAILARVREQRIHHPRSTVQRYVTVSAGIVSLMPGASDKPEVLLERAQGALKEAKTGGRNRAVASRE